MALNIWTKTWLLQEIRGYLTVQEIYFATDNTDYYKQTVVIQSDEYNWNTIILMLKGEGWDPISRYNPTISLCLFPSRTWVPNIICRGFVEMRGDCMFCWDERWLYVLLRWEVIVCFVEMRGDCMFCWDERRLYVLLRWEVIVCFVEIFGIVDGNYSRVILEAFILSSNELIYSQLNHSF
jgi:hypothetical protein